MALRLAAKGIFALGAATAAYFSCSPLSRDTSSTTPFASPPRVAQQHFTPAWDCGDACTRILPTQTRISPIPSPEFVISHVNLTNSNQTNTAWLELPSLLFDYTELSSAEPTYDISSPIFILIDISLSTSYLGRRIHKLAPTQLPALVALSFGTLNFMFPWITLPTKLDLLIPLWCVGVTIILAILNTPTFNGIQRRKLEFTKELQAQVETTTTELAHRDESLADYRSRLIEKEEETRDAKRDRDVAQAESNEAGLALDSRNEEISELRQKIVTINETSTRLKAEKAASDKDAQTAKEQHESAQATFATTLEQKDSTISRLEASERNLSRRVENMEQEERGMAKQVKDQKTELAALNRVNDYRGEQIQDLKSRDRQLVSLLTSADETVDNLRTELEEERTETVKLREALYEKAQRIEVVQGEKGSVMAELEEVKGAYASAQQALDDLRHLEESAELIREERDALLAYKEQAEMGKAQLRAEAETATAQLAAKDRSFEEARETQDAALQQLATEQTQHIQRLVEEHTATVKDLEGTQRAVVQELEEKLSATNATVEELHCRVLEGTCRETATRSLATPPVTPASSRVVGLPPPSEGSLAIETPLTTASVVEDPAPSYNNITTAPPPSPESSDATQASSPQSQSLGIWEALAQATTVAPPTFTFRLPTTFPSTSDQPRTEKKVFQSPSCRGAADQSVISIERDGNKRRTKGIPRQFKATSRIQTPAVGLMPVPVATVAQAVPVVSKNVFGAEAFPIPTLNVATSSIPQAKEVPIVDTIKHSPVQVTEALKPATTLSTGKSKGPLETSRVARTDQGHPRAGVPMTGSESSQDRAQIGERGYRPMPRKLRGLPAHAIQATQTPVQPTFPSAAGPSQGPSFQTPANPSMAIPTPASILRTTPTVPGPRARIDFGGRSTAFQPSSPSGSSTPLPSRSLSSTSRPLAKSVQPAKPRGSVAAREREAFIKSLHEWAYAEESDGGESADDGVDGEEDDDEEDDDDEATKRWRQKLGR